MRCERPDPSKSVLTVCRTFALPLLLLALFLNGCARPLPVTEISDARILWSRFLETRNPLPPQSGFSLSGSINYASPDRSHRVLLQVWGNPEYPIRADIRAGIGAHIAFLREDHASSLAYFPRQNQAFLSPAQGIRTPEISLPFSLMELSAISLNTWETLLPEEYLSTRFVPGIGWAYSFDDPRIDTLVIGFDGQPVTLQGSNGRSWELSFQRWSRDGERDYPSRMVLTLDTDERAIIAFKELTVLPKRWAEEALDLPLPPDARVFHGMQQMEVP
jgi:hypothetical protein